MQTGGSRRTVGVLAVLALVPLALVVEGSMAGIVIPTDTLGARGATMFDPPAFGGLALGAVLPAAVHKAMVRIERIRPRKQVKHRSSSCPEGANPSLQAAHFAVTYCFPSTKPSSDEPPASDNPRSHDDQSQR